MAYFPAFIKLDNQKILIVGGGKIASDKLEHLLDFTNDIKIVAPDTNEKMLFLINKYNLNFQKRVYSQDDLKNINIVIVAIDNIPLQKEIYTQSKQHSCLCNSVDSVEYCDFIFPSYIKKDDLTIAISTCGTSPAFAKHFKKFLNDILPNNIGEFLKTMKEYRKIMPKGKQRMKFLDNKAKNFIDKLGDNR